MVHKAALLTPPGQEWQQSQGFRKPLPINLMGDFSIPSHCCHSIIQLEMSISASSLWTPALLLNWHGERPLIDQKATDIGYQCKHNLWKPVYLYVELAAPCQSTLCQRYIFGAGHTGVTAIVKADFISQAFDEHMPTFKQRCARFYYNEYGSGGGTEPPTRGLWFRCSNQLSYSQNRKVSSLFVLI